MRESQLIYPMFAMVLLTFSVLVRLFRARVAALAAGTININYFRLYQGGVEPESSAAFSRSLISQFEAPVLFYVICLATMTMHAQSMVLVVLAWCYFIFRAIHVYIHTGKNKIKYRMRVYFLSWIVLLSMWVTLIVKVTAS
jgi:hypothetical protein